MPTRIALCQINTVPGDIPGNRARIHEGARRAHDLGAHLAVFPELALVGYSPRDLLFRQRFVAAAEEALKELAGESSELAIVLGTVRSRSGPGRPFHNAAAWLEKGVIRGFTHKSLLPVYDVFDEARYFEAGEPAPPFGFRGLNVGVTICEDIWTDPQALDAPGYARDPALELARLGADVIVNLSASPFHVGKIAARATLVSQVARRAARPVLLCNLWGGNDEILFDGSSIAADHEGTILARARSFDDDVLVVEIPTAAKAGEVSRRDDDLLDDLRLALVLGIRDYAQKCGFRSAVLGLSGGIDSALTAALAVEALGAANVRGVAMPSRFSSPESVEDARDLASRLGIAFSIVPIDGAYTELVARASEIVFPAPFGIMEENIQARIRGVLLMAVSNRTGALLITTGNKSEMAVGYCTLYGDMCGGLAAISDVYKTDVFRLAARYVGQGRIPERSLTKPPSAELRPDQKDQDSLPPYDLLDGILALHIDEGKGAREISRQVPGCTLELADRVLGMVARSEYKRKQAPPGIRVSRKAFGTGRRVPLVAASLRFLDDPAASHPGRRV